DATGHAGGLSEVRHRPGDAVRKAAVLRELAAELLAGALDEAGVGGAADAEHDPRLAGVVRGDVLVGGGAAAPQRLVGDVHGLRGLGVAAAVGVMEFDLGEPGGLEDALGGAGEEAEAAPVLGVAGRGL